MDAELSPDRLLFQQLGFESSDLDDWISIATSQRMAW